MVKCRCWKVITILFKIFLGISASTHWVVTENGRIQSQLDSAFHMRRPYDLLSLLEQEERAGEIERLYREMVRRKMNIDEEWAGLESATELEARLYTFDPDCVQAGRPLSDVDLYTSVGEDGFGREGIDLEELSPSDVPYTTDRPDCAAMLDLDFTMRNFPHLQVLSWNLTSGPEVFGNLKALSERTGHQIAAGLRYNHTSWFLHNLAALFWRNQGDAFRALQCAKRAVYLAPRQHRDIALLNLGCIVQQARCPAEAAILLHAAVDHAPHIPASHFALANVYAILGDYNRSVACYDNALQLQPHWLAAKKNKFAVLCHQKLENSLYQLHRSLQDILHQLHEYHGLQEQWLKHQEELMYQQAPLEVKLQGLQHEPLSTLLEHRGEKCVPRIEDGGNLLSCDSKMLAHHLQIDITLSLQMLLKNVESQAQKISDQMSRRLISMGRTEGHKEEKEMHPDTMDEVDMDDGESGLEIFIDTGEDKIEENVANDVAETDTRASTNFSPFKHPKLHSLKNVGAKFKDSVIRFFEDLMKRQQFDRQMPMPDQQCQASSLNSDGCLEDLNHWLLPDMIDDDSKEFNILPLARTLGIVVDGNWVQNASLQVITTLVVTCIQLSQWDSSEIPTTNDEPHCSSVPSSLVDLPVDSFRHMSSEPRLKSLFYSLLLNDDVNLSDFTAHLSHALKDKTRHDPSSSWLLETAAALYWRCLGDTHQMVSCLQAAVHKAPPNLKDFPLQHVAQILFTLGHHQEALVLGSHALKVSPHSIDAHMVLYETYLALGEPDNALKHGKMILYQESQGVGSP